MIPEISDSTAQLSSAGSAALLHHLRDEERWLQENLARLYELRAAVAGYNLMEISLCLERQRAHETAGAALQARRAAIRSQLSDVLRRPPAQITLSRVLPHLPHFARTPVRELRQTLLVLARDVAALQQETQELVLHVHNVSQAILSEVFGGRQAGARYAADGELCLPAGAAVVELRS